MKINILVSLIEGPYGGGNQFLKVLRKDFVKNNIYEEDPEKADIILFNSYPFGEEFRFYQTFELKRKGKLLIHRVDGPIFKLRGRDFEIDKIIYKYNQLFADATIFQSEWSKKENYKYGIRKNTYETVIHNAPDNIIFNSKNKIEFNPERKIKLIASSWSKNWRKGFKIYSFLDEKLDFTKYEMTFVGNSPIKFKNIKNIKPLSSKDLAYQLKQHDIYITASENDPCSNSLIEALSCELPAVVLNDGGHPELIGKGGITFESTMDVIHKIEILANNYQIYQKKINISNIDEIAQKYYIFIKSIYDQCQKKIYKQKKPSFFNKLRINFLIINSMINNESKIFCIKKMIKTYKYFIINLIKRN